MRRSFFLLLTAAVLLSSNAAHACGVCMGQGEGSQIGGAVNGAIFVMLGFIGFILMAIGGVAFSIWRRASAPLPPHVEFADVIGTQPTSK